MGFGMHNSSMVPRGNGLNYNLKGDASVHTFVEAAGLNIQNFPEYLAGIVANGNDLASLSNESWNQILAPMELGKDRAARVHKAISDLRLRAAREDAERNQTQLQTHLANGGSHPNTRPNADVYEPKLNGARPKTVDYEKFIPVAFFQGERQGWMFKHGDEGLGYYRDEVGAGLQGGSNLTGAFSNAARSANPTSQADLEEKVAATQQKAYIQSRQQALLLERRQRLEEQQQHNHQYSQGQVANMYADARLRSSPFATGY